jgi:hypothetical protein
MQGKPLECSSRVELVEFIFLCSVALEVLEECPCPDVVIVPCGGGALLAGIASAIKLKGLDNCLVYGVEPEGGIPVHCTIFECFYY